MPLLGVGRFHSLPKLKQRIQSKTQDDQTQRPKSGTVEIGYPASFDGAKSKHCSD
jgi:hypothetical protein